MPIGKSAAFGTDFIALLVSNRFFALVVKSSCTSTLVSAPILAQCPDRPESSAHQLPVRSNGLLACRQGAELLKDVFWQNQVWCE